MASYTRCERMLTLLNYNTEGKFDSIKKMLESIQNLEEFAYGFLRFADDDCYFGGCFHFPMKDLISCFLQSGRFDDLFARFVYYTLKHAYDIPGRKLEILARLEQHPQLLKLFEHAEEETRVVLLEEEFIREDEETPLPQERRLLHEEEERTHRLRKDKYLLLRKDLSNVRLMVNFKNHLRSNHREEVFTLLLESTDTIFTMVETFEREDIKLLAAMLLLHDFYIIVEQLIAIAKSRHSFKTISQLLTGCNLLTESCIFGLVERFSFADLQHAYEKRNGYLVDVILQHAVNSQSTSLLDFRGFKLAVENDNPKHGMILLDIILSSAGDHATRDFSWIEEHIEAIAGRPNWNRVIYRLIELTRLISPEVSFSRYALASAIKGNNHPLVRRLRKEGFDVNIRSRCGKPLIFLAGEVENHKLPSYKTLCALLEYIEGATTLNVDVSYKALKYLHYISAIPPWSRHDITPLKSKMLIKLLLHCNARVIDERDFMGRTIEDNMLRTARRDEYAILDIFRRKLDLLRGLGDFDGDAEAKKREYGLRIREFPHVVRPQLDLGLDDFGIAMFEG